MPQTKVGGAHLEQGSANGLWSDGKKATHKCSRVEGGFSGSSKVQGPVPKPNSVGGDRHLNNGSLHKQTGRNPLCSPVEDDDLVPSLSDNPKSQTHSRVFECEWREVVCPGCISETVRCRKLILGRDIG